GYRRARHRIGQRRWIRHKAEHRSPKMRSKPLAAVIRAAISPTAPAAATKSSPRLQPLSRTVSKIPATAELVSEKVTERKGSEKVTHFRFRCSCANANPVKSLAPYRERSGRRRPR